MNSEKFIDMVVQDAIKETWINSFKERQKIIDAKYKYIMGEFSKETKDEVIYADDE